MKTSIEKLGKALHAIEFKKKSGYRMKELIYLDSFIWVCFLFTSLLLYIRGCNAIAVCSGVLQVLNW